MHSLIGNGQHQDSRLTLFLTTGFEQQCCTDQKCSRFIQDRLQKLCKQPNNQELNSFMIRLLRNPNINFNEMVIDLFGNYVIQSIIQLPNLQKEFLDIIFEKIKGNFYNFSINIHGCRVMQTCFDFFSFQQKEELVFELLRCRQVKTLCFDFNGNHVIQKIIMMMGKISTSQIMASFVNVLEDWIIDCCVHEYSCRIVQRMFEYCHPSF